MSAALLLLPMNGSHNSSHHHNPLDNHSFFLASKVLVGVMSALSVCGGLLIAVSWLFSACCRGRNSSNPAPRPTPPRNVLFNLSIADSLVAISHLMGVSTNFKKHSDAGTLDDVCTVQGSLATYSTIASFLWTIVLTFLVTVTLTLNKSKKFGTIGALVVYLMICWGLPLVLVCIFFAIKQFGYDEDDNLLWCYTKPWGRTALKKDSFNVISYDFWLLTTIVFLLVLLGTVCCRKLKKRTSDDETVPILGNENNINAARADYKLIFVAVILILLRLWDLPVEFMLYSDSIAGKFNHTYAAAALLLLGGICDSAQGFANAILFLLFTREYRVWIGKGLKDCCCPPRFGLLRRMHSLQVNANSSDVYT